MRELAVGQRGTVNPGEEGLEFEKALDAVFEEKGANFSPELRSMLREFWEQGIMVGRARERAEFHTLTGTRLSDCGNYWCVPLATGNEMHLALPDTRLVRGVAGWGAGVHVGWGHGSAFARERFRANNPEIRPEVLDLLWSAICKALETPGVPAEIAHSFERVDVTWAINPWAFDIDLSLAYDQLQGELRGQGPNGETMTTRLRATIATGAEIVGRREYHVRAAWFERP